MILKLANFGANVFATRDGDINLSSIYTITEDELTILKDSYLFEETCYDDASDLICRAYSKLSKNSIFNAYKYTIQNRKELIKKGLMSEQDFENLENSNKIKRILKANVVGEINS